MSVAVWNACENASGRKHTNTKWIDFTTPSVQTQHPAERPHNCCCYIEATHHTQYTQAGRAHTYRLSICPADRIDQCNAGLGGRRIRCFEGHVWFTRYNYPLAELSATKLIFFLTIGARCKMGDDRDNYIGSRTDTTTMFSIRFRRSEVHHRKTRRREEQLAQILGKRCVPFFDDDTATTNPDSR